MERVSLLSKRKLIGFGKSMYINPNGIPGVRKLEGGIWYEDSKGEYMDPPSDFKR